MLPRLVRKLFVVCSITLIFLTGVGFIWFFYSPIEAKAVGSYELPLTITNTVNTTFSNYQIRVVINSATLISAGKMRSDCGDIRFFDSDGITPMNYYLDKGCNTTSTVVWTKVPSVPANSTKIITMEYGDPVATSQSTGSGTMDQFDDMQTTPTCALKNSATYDSVNKWIQLTPATSNLSGQCEYTYNPGDGFYSKFEYWTGGGTGADATWIYAWSQSTPVQEDLLTNSNRGYHFTVDEFQDRMCYTKSLVSNGACIAQSTQTTLDNSTWREVEVYQSGLNGTMLLDGAQVVNANDTASRVKSANVFGIAARTSTSNNIHRIRKVFFAEYNAGVSLSTGSEISKQATDSTISFAIRNSTDTANTNTCALGTLSQSTLGSCSYRLKVSSNGTGYSISMRTDGGLADVGYTITDAAVGTGGGGGTAITGSTVGLESYGVVISPGLLTSGSSVARSAAYNARAQVFLPHKFPQKLSIFPHQ